MVLPEITVSLGDNAKKIVVNNAGNAPGYRIHVALVPFDIEFDNSELCGPDAQYEYLLHPYDRGGQ